jgi:hypothetical protein
MKMGKEEFFDIFPAIRVRYSSNGYFIEQYQAGNDAWIPIKFYYESNIREKHLKALWRLIRHRRGIKK